jgi:exodeoxyribonuclease VIII
VQIEPGVYSDVTNEQYHTGYGVSKSGLWTITTRSPAHYCFAPREGAAHFDFGEACHLAILQPNEFEGRVFRGPDDRRGKKWTDVIEWCQHENKLPLTSGDYDEVLALRDMIHSDSWLNGIITGGKPQIENSAYWIDERTGVLCRCRPDFYRADLGLIVDLKSTKSAHPDAFSRSVVNYGYHAQEAFYSDGWTQTGNAVDGFVFLAFEKTPPYARAVYELPPEIVIEGRAIIERALDTYAACRFSDIWPGYPSGVQNLEFKRWAYRHTDPSDFEE